ncbi:MAG TPA: DUF6152 family protein [Gammaproteobacteria bacterium]|nr:DUF6152 family protein [Gammaproteobacteria bacterium]
MTKRIPMALGRKLLRAFAAVPPSLAVVLLAAVARPIAAHHSFGAEYDVRQPITLTGVLTKVEWTNPHTHIYLDVKDEQGKVVNWQLEGYPPVALHRIGWRQNVTMKVGDTLTVTGWRARDGGSWGHSREITLPSGEKMMFGPPAGTGDGGSTPAVDVR